MAKRKWYVVTVGKDVGVFPTWLEAGPLVKGVPEALHQSFTTEEEARRTFAQAQARGEIRIVDGDTGPKSPSRTTNRGITSNISGTPLSSGRLVMNNGISRSSGTPRGGAHTPNAPVQLSSPALSRSASEPSSRFHRLEIIESVFKKNNHDVRAGAPAQASLGSTMSSPAVLRQSTQEDRAETPNVVVKTPTWLTSYPRRPHHSDSQPLSPLNSADLPLNTFISEPLVEEMVFAKQPPSITNGHPKPPSVHLHGAESVGDSSIYLPSPHPDLLAPVTQYGHDMDPRSPIMRRSQVPELAFISSLAFSRPSPSAKSKKMPVQWSAPKSSLLFQSSS